MNKSPKSNPNIKKNNTITAGLLPITQEGKQLEKKHNSEKQKIKIETEQKLALATAGQIQSVILSMDEIGITKGEKSFSEETKTFIQPNSILRGKTLEQIIKSPILNKRLLKILQSKENLNKRQTELKNYIEPLDNFYIRSAKLLGKEKLDKKDLFFINKEQKDFKKEFEKSYKNWEEENLYKFEKKPGKSTKGKLVPIENNKTNADQNSYNIYGNILSIDSKKGTSKFMIKENDKFILENKESKKNYIDFAKTLNYLGLKDIWNYKNEIINILNSKIKVTGIDIKDNFLGENEQMIFLNYILISLGEKQIKSNNIEEYKNQYINKYATYGNFKNDIIKKGSSTIEEIFFKTFINNGDFNESKFIKEIQQQKGK